MFDIMKFASDNHVEVDVRPGKAPVVWEFFVRDRSIDEVQFTQILDRELARQYNVDGYLEQRCNALMEEVREARRQRRKSA